MDVILHALSLVLRICSLLVPARARARWLEEWRAEVAVVRARGSRAATLKMAAGSVRDAWCLRRELRRDRLRRRGGIFHALDQDVRYACRGILAAPRFSCAVVGSLAVGLAATSASFGFLHAIMFRGFPGVTEQERVVRVGIYRGCGWPGCWIDSSTTAEYDLLRSALPAIGGLAASTNGSAAIRIGVAAYSVRAAAVSTNYFDVLGLQPALGRGFGADRDVAVLSDSLWRRLFETDRNVLGRFIEVAGRPVQIVGVMPRFEGVAKGNMELGGSYGLELWVPLDLAPLFVRAATYSGGRSLPANEYRIDYVGRLEPGATLAQARADAAVATARVKAARPDVYSDGWVDVRGVWVNEPAEAARLLTNFMMVPLIVLAIACVNAANLLLARGNERVRETAVRLALGASRWRVVRQLLVESLLLAIAAGIVAIPVMSWLLGLAEAGIGTRIPLSRPALIFAAAATLACAVGFGLAPSLSAVAKGPSPLGSSRPGDAGPGRMRVRRWLVVAQVALSLGLLATAGQVLAAVHEMMARTGATDPDRILMLSFDLDQLKIAPPAGEAFYADLLDRASRLPQIESAALARRGALWTWGRGVGQSPIVVWKITDAEKDARVYLGGYVRGDLFRTTGLKLVQGRSFLPEDAEQRAPVAIVSRAFADTQLGGRALGAVIKVGGRQQKLADAREVRIVGVVEPPTDLGYSKRPLAAVYVATPLAYEPALSLYVRLRARGDSILPAVTAIVRDLHPRVPIAEVATLEALTERRYFEEQFMARALATLGAIALSLATAGLYAVVSFMVASRRRELGIRIALGASPSGILRLVLRQSSRMAVIGGGIGFVAALILGAVVRANLVGAPGIDPVLLLAAAAVLGAAMAAASVLPARRAARVDPISALRQE